MCHTGQVSRAGEVVSSMPQAAPPYLTSTALAVDSLSTALADVRDSALAESPLTELLLNEEAKLTLEKVLEESEDNPSTSTDNEETSVANIYATPCIDNQNLQENNNIRFDEPHQWVRIETTNQNERNMADLTREQADTINLACNNMTPSQQELADMHNWKLNMATAQVMADSSPVINKGKGPNPCNWGEADLLGEELEPGVQHQILEEYNAHQDELNTVDNETAGTENLDSENNPEEEEEASGCLTHEELQEKLQLNGN
ncbi:hypothetical protein H2248_008572 [Termitomyces sp. 'cryptogamus']|nr:hypothetical protein H2248_008572 [Termitomyces sp. 'cryptogamus']